MLIKPLFPCANHKSTSLDYPSTTMDILKEYEQVMKDCNIMAQNLLSYDTPNGKVYQIVLGAPKENLDVTYTNGVVHIKSSRPTPDGKTVEFNTSVRMGKPQASYENGVLTLTEQKESIKLL